MGSDNPFYHRTLRLLAGKRRNWDTLDAVRDIAGLIGATPSQVALSWLTNRPAVTAPIIAASNLAQLEETSPAPTSSSTRLPPSASTTSAPPTPERLPLRALRREAARPLHRLQRASDQRADLGKVTQDWTGRTDERDELWSAPSSPGLCRGDVDVPHTSFLIWPRDSTIHTSLDLFHLSRTIT